MKWCMSIIISRIFTVKKLSSSMQWCKENGLSAGYCEGLYLVKNQFMTAKWQVYVNSCFSIFANIDLYWI